MVTLTQFYNAPFPKGRGHNKLCGRLDSVACGRPAMIPPLSVLTLFGRLTVTFDLLTSNLMRIITRLVGNLLTHFVDISVTFCY